MQEMVDAEPQLLAIGYVSENERSLRYQPGLSGRVGPHDLTRP